MHSRSARTFHHCLQKRFISFTQEFSLVVWLRVPRENEPKKSWSVPTFLGLSDRPKKKIRSSVPECRIQVLLYLLSLTHAWTRNIIKLFLGNCLNWIEKNIREQGRCKTLVRELLIPPMWLRFRRILHAASCVG